MVLFFNFAQWNFSDPTLPWMIAASKTCNQISSSLFLASLSPLHFRVGRFNILYVIPYTIPLVISSILLEGVFQGVEPTGPLFLIFPALAAITVVAILFWSTKNGGRTAWLAGAACTVLGCIDLAIFFHSGARSALVFVFSTNHIATALLLVCVFRRLTPGVVLSTAGFAAWSLTLVHLAPGDHATLNIHLVHVIVMSKLVAAMGMILLALEDELLVNKAAEERERKTRVEVMAYSSLMLYQSRTAEFDQQGTEICQTVVTHSRFAQAALLLLDGSGRWYCVAGSAGLDAATVAALSALATRIPMKGFLTPGSAPSAVEHSQTLKLDLDPWLEPGDDLKRLRFDAVLAVPMPGRTGTEGTLLLAGMRNSQTDRQGQLIHSLRADDLLPVEMLVARLQSVRSQTMMLEKLIDSEKLSTLGLLAGSITHQLNNPLAVVMGFASLLQGDTDLDLEERKCVEAILSESRRMSSILESLSRVLRPKADKLAAVSVAQLLGDLGELHRSEFLQRSIDFQLKIDPELPNALCRAQEMRLAVLQCLQFAIEAVEHPDSALLGFNGSVSDKQSPNAVKFIRLEATSMENRVQILVAHSGPGFLNPERAFDSTNHTQKAGDVKTLGLNLCAAILRDNNGRTSAINLEPRGAAIILDLQTA